MVLPGMRSSEWDRLPAELRDMVFEAAGPLTMIAVGRLPPWQLRRLDTAAREALWAEALAIDWHGPLWRLPCISAFSCVFRGVRSQRMVDRLRALRLASDGPLLHGAVRCRLMGTIDTAPPVLAAVVAASEGAVWLAEAVMSEDSSTVEPWLLAETAARSGHGDVVMWAYRHRNPAQPWPRSVMDGAASRGLGDLVAWLHERQLDCSEAAMDGAAANGHLDVVKWLHENRDEGCTVAAMDGAAANGHLDVLEWLQANRSEGCCIAAAVGAATKGHLIVLQWLHIHFFHLFTASNASAIFQGAADTAQAHVMAWLYDIGVRGNLARAMHRALLGGSLEAAQWLSRHADIPENYAVFTAIDGGSVAVVSWLLQRGVPAGSRSMARAAASGNIEMMRELHAAGVPLGNIAAREAASSGQLHVISFLLETAPHAIDASVIDAAELGGWPDILLMLLLSHRPPPSPTTVEQRISRAFSAISARGVASVLTWLDPNACITGVAGIDEHTDLARAWRRTVVECAQETAAQLDIMTHLEASADA
ncbi:hypothetical protein HK105_206307 [Polyrhizophydium stewartii]|uniref:Ankyrin repeat domain containing protein n=1 Tax=Polyrhizophydium stewartii TaxID=2732419 RepID=A0ABR4N3U4_9FUNG